MKGRETRYFHDFEVRADEDEAMTLAGHFSTFNDPYPLGDFYEQVAPDAFDDALSDDADVFALWNHNTDNVLARTKTGTLRLGKDKRGPTSEIDIPKSAARERESIERGDVDKMSFAFTTVAEEWEEGAGPDGMDLRTLKKVELHEVSPVTFPANPNTDIAKRSHEEWRSKREPEEGTVKLKGKVELDAEKVAEMIVSAVTLQEVGKKMSERVTKSLDAGPTMDDLRKRRLEDHADAVAD